MPEIIQQPPQACGVEAAALVIHDDARPVVDTELQHQGGERFGRRQKRRRVFRIANRSRRGVHGAGHVAISVAALPHVDHADAIVECVRSDPIRLDELFGMRIRHREDGQQWKHRARV